MRPSVIGASYVGLTAAACLAQIGHEVFRSESELEKLAKPNSDDVRFVPSIAPDVRPPAF
jgi:UDP-glucose 6-dehydrogenase